jgi:hypothetical protein
MRHSFPRLLAATPQDYRTRFSFQMWPGSAYPGNSPHKPRALGSRGEHLNFWAALSLRFAANSCLTLP